MFKWIRIITGVFVGIPTVYNMIFYFLKGPDHLPLRIIFPLCIVLVLFIKRKKMRYVLTGLSIIGIITFIYMEQNHVPDGVKTGFYFTKTILYDFHFEQHGFFWLFFVTIPIFIYPILLITALSKSAKVFYSPASNVNK